MAVPLWVGLTSKHGCMMLLLFLPCCLLPLLGVLVDGELIRYGVLSMFIRFLRFPSCHLVRCIMRCH